MVSLPIPHCAEVPISVFTLLPDLTGDEMLLETIDDTDSSVSSISSFSSVAVAASSLSAKPKPFSQGQLNDLVRDLGLSEELSEILASRLGEHDILDSGTKITFYRDRDDLLICFFTIEDDFVYCNNIQDLLSKNKSSRVQTEEWRLFINNSKRSLKCVLLNNGSKFTCVPTGHFVIVKKHYMNVKMVLQKVLYSEHNWAICVDFKMINFLLGQQRGEVHQTSLFSLLLGQSHYWSSVGKEGLAEREDLAMGDKNIIHEPLVNRDRIILPRLYVKLGLMKQFVKALD